jgi:hypothetical protein
MSEVEVHSRLAKVVHIKRHEYNGAVLEVVINRGAQQGIKLGERFLVFGIGPNITDPDTGEDLGALELVRGQGVVVHVQEHLSTIRSSERRRTRPAKRIIRDPDHDWSRLSGVVGRAYFGSPASVIEEDLAPEEEVPFDSVQLGDLAKPV